MSYKRACGGLRPACRSRAHVGSGVGGALHQPRRAAERDEEPSAQSARPQLPWLYAGAAERAVQKVERLVAAEFTDPSCLSALGSSRFIRFRATRGLQIRKPTARRGGCSG